MKEKKAGATKMMALAVSLILIVIVMVTTLINLTYVSSIKKLVRSTTVNNISELTASKAQNLDERLRSEQVALEFMAGSIGMYEDIFSLSDIITEYQETHQASCMWIFDLQGNGWSSGPGNDLLPPGQTEELFAAALRGESGMSDPFIGEKGRKQILFYTPIKREGKMIGGLYESYPVELLQNTYGSGTYNDEGYSYVLGKEGEVILSSLRFSYLQIYENFRNVLNNNGENDQKDISAFMEALKTGEKGNATFTFEGDEQFLYFIPLEEKEGWYFVTVIPLDMVEQDGTVIVMLTIRMAVILLLAVAVVLVLAVTAIYYRNKKRRDYEIYIQNTYQAISQNIDTVIFIVEPKTKKVEYVFDNAQEILGIPAQSFNEPEESSMGEFQHAISDFLWMEPPKSKFTWERSLYNDVLGRQMWLEITVHPVTLGGQPKCIYAVTDHTQERQIREKLSAAVAAAEQANAGKSQFLSNMSHDIRTPMNAIVGMTKLAKIHMEDKSKVYNCLHKIELSSRHLLNLINDVLDMSKIESGKMTMTVEDFSLSELIEGAAAIVQPQCKSKGQIFAVETKNIRHEYLIGDMLRMNQVIFNLISNAVKFTPPKGKITVFIEELSQKRSGYAIYRFQISDTGSGIAPEFLSSIFLPFEREDTRNVHHTEGSGLGLAIAKNIVEAMGGQIAVESELGKGTTFTVELELQLQKDEKEEGENDRVLKRLHALVADDSEEDLTLLNSYLTEFGMAVDIAATQEDMLSMVSEKDSYDLIIIGGMTEYARENRFLIISDGTVCGKLVMLLNSDDPAEKFNMAEREVDLILQKPILKSTLCKNLSILFDEPAPDDADGSLQDIMKGRRFLLVEDNELNREIATEFFGLSGAVVEDAEDGKAGLEAFLSKEAGYYDAVFMDIQMPVMDGYEATRRIRASEHRQAKDIPIIAMSANVFAEDKRASKLAGMNAHLGKPIMMDEVYHVLRELL
ncbi:ATP-binding protein [Ruminococcus sp. OA3]|uniref:ATP-binding protein n=1 Tax=Ruminococcus sp. OA3 TaxID=2914164 RepID=UPI001F052265|nr:ATP-binding protein [Ruminococcus sp. OA3]MCH1983003.1 ATP-binding protein [Ruminococcus sp. OA3]